MAGAMNTPFPKSREMTKENRCNKITKKDPSTLQRYYQIMIFYDFLWNFARFNSVQFRKRS